MRTCHHLQSAQNASCSSGFHSVLPHFPVESIFVILKCNIKYKRGTYRLTFNPLRNSSSYGQNIKPDLNPLTVQLFFALHRARLSEKCI